MQGFALSVMHGLDAGTPKSRRKEETLRQFTSEITSSQLSITVSSKSERNSKAKGPIVSAS
jgi:hypothetical protein